MGKMRVGKKANFRSLDNDARAGPEADILRIETMITIVGGNMVYKRAML